jgi:hypothetical protein
MQASQIPTRIPLAFAASGTKNAIPTASQIGITPGAASLTDGFPPLTFTPISSGGVPPAGADFNGILNLITAVEQWQCAGGWFTFNAAFSTAIGGYPKYATLIGASGISYTNLADNNTTDPEGGSPLNWGPGQGVTPAQFDATNKIATMAAVQRALGSSAGISAYSSNTTLTGPNDAGKWVFASTPGLTFTLPLASSLSPGTMINVAGNGSGVTVVRQGSDIITYSLSPTSATIAPYDTAIFLVVSNGNWYLVGGESHLATSSSFASSLAANGYQKLPSGLLVQWGLTGATVAGQVNTFPIAFPSAVFAVTAAIAATSASAAIAVNVQSLSQAAFYSSVGAPAVYYFAIGK